MVVWRAANGICSKRLVPFLPELVPILEGYGHLRLDDEVRARLLSLSAATADRMVRRLREADRPHGISTTKPGRLLKRRCRCEHSVSGSICGPASSRPTSSRTAVAIPMARFCTRCV